MNIAQMIKSSIRKTAITASMIASVMGGLAIGLNIAAAVAANAPDPVAHSDGVMATLDDTAITAKVKSKLMGERSLKNSDISVTTTNGVVTLTGRATSSKAKSLAEADASKVEGVKSVDNALTTPSTNKTVAKTERVMSDSWITTKVKSEILSDSISKSFDVAVTTTHGVVVLKGTLANRDAVLHVKDIASKVQGVKSVDTSALVVAHD